MAILDDDDRAFMRAETDRMIAALTSGRTSAAARPATGGNGSASGGVVKFGRNKGQRFADVPPSELQWYRDAIQRSVDDPEKARWRDANLDDLAAIDRAMSGGAGPEAPAIGAQDSFGGGGDSDIPFASIDGRLYP